MEWEKTHKIYTGCNMGGCWTYYLEGVGDNLYRIEVDDPSSDGEYSWEQEVELKYVLDTFWGGEEGHDGWVNDFQDMGFDEYYEDFIFRLENILSAATSENDRGFIEILNKAISKLEVDKKEFKDGEWEGEYGPLSSENDL